MNVLSNLRGGLLLSSACAVLAACSGSGSNENNGDAGPVTVVPGGGGGGGTNAVNLVPSGFTCPAGTAQGTLTESGTDITACLISGGTFTDDLNLPGTFGGQRVGYGIGGSVFIGENLISNPSGATATLDIGAGAILFGQNGEDVLVINPGSQINAAGTAAQPIVMTSKQDVADGSVDDGSSSGDTTVRGQWGGLTINGLAPINDCDVTTATPATAACNKTGEGGTGLYGGDDPMDSSGTLSYVRVQYAGFQFNGEDELNGISFQGVGEGTQLSHIQVHNSQDDGVEFYGGTVNGKYIVITGSGDDSIDWTDGWDGDLQYALVIQDDTDGDRGIEADNRSNDTDILPRSNPNLSNLTLFGGATGSDGMKLRAGTDGNIANAIVIGFGDGVDFDQQSTAGVEPTVASIYTAGNNGIVDITATDSVEASGNTMNGVIPGQAERAVPVTNNSVGNSLDTPTYIGAFDPLNETNGSNWTTGWTITNYFPPSDSTGCPSGTAVSGDPVPAGRSENLVCILPNAISEDLTLTNGNLYTFEGTVFVGTDAGANASDPKDGFRATLTIEPGVTIYGRSGEDALVITRGSKIEALGTAAAPIVLTAASDVEGTVQQTERGLWGGLAINGRAPINDCDVTTVDPVANPELCEKTGEGGTGLYGGNDPDDDSGTLNYVRVMYAGFQFNGEDELNGISLHGTGRGTEIEYVQVHNAQDDGVEWYGGTSNAKYLVITGSGDDSLDWTDGWNGNAQYAIIVQSDDDGDRGMEVDNRSNDTDILPRSNALISNFTIIGGATNSDGVKVRAGTDGNFYNGIITNTNDGVDFDQQSTLGAAPTFFSTYIVDVTREADSEAIAEGVWADGLNGNVGGDTRGQSSTLTASGTTTALAPGANELAVTPTSPGNPFFDDTTYIGAVENDADDWYVGWTFGL
ncbi:hypothetical protein [Aquisalinus flavus]|uniref:Lipoprotein n=1 Tax=Aquisalinus flavus TaxID=1526572 RepID=A0A8J2V1J5_9PROT|nr:hypothetical protein [Aquisalinus flavus]MBD0427316.1 hypothetical protein [Aquisalinus flavus]UNE47122.1 hypothetical protein FF099_03150 [Aquisalinus flavus]GGD00032.1 hypothetical protein GCM10011342_06310 [Aquisalinus flavus]